MDAKILISALLILPLSALARASSGVGEWIAIAALLGAAYVITLITIGGPIALINKLSGRKSNDEIGGKVFALSFLLGPVVGAPLMYVFEKSEAGIGLALGWVASMFILNIILSRGEK